MSRLLDGDADFVAPGLQRKLRERLVREFPGRIRRRGHAELLDVGRKWFAVPIVGGCQDVGHEGLAALQSRRLAAARVVSMLRPRDDGNRRLSVVGIGKAAAVTASGNFVAGQKLASACTTEAGASPGAAAVTGATGDGA